jgi:hypothetical protein
MLYSSTLSRQDKWTTGRGWNRSWPVWGNSRHVSGRIEEYHNTPRCG